MELRLDSRTAGASAVWRWWHGRFGSRFLREAAIVVGLLVVYRLGRTLGRHETARAFDHAREVLHVENLLSIDTERSLQQVALGHLGVVRS